MIEVYIYLSDCNKYSFKLSHFLFFKMINNDIVKNDVQRPCKSPYGYQFLKMIWRDQIFFVATMVYAWRQMPILIKRLLEFSLKEAMDNPLVDRKDQ